MEHVINDSVLTNHIEYFFIVDFKEFNISLHDFLEFLQSFELGFERSLFFEAVDDETHIFLFYVVVFFLLFYHIRIDLEHFEVIFKFVVG